MRRLLVLVLLLSLPTLLAASAGGGQQELDVTIQPGVFIELSGGSLCTLNWIFDEVVPEDERDEREPRVLAGTAAHCADAVGESVSLATPSVGIIYLPGPTFGTVVHLDDEVDFALVEIDPAFHPHVDPAMKGHPSIPTGLSTVETAAFGDVMQFSGNGIGYNQTAVTREERVGLLSANNGRWHWIVGSVTPGDSGGPVANVTDGGKAFGLATAIAVGYVHDSTTGLQAGAAGVSLEGALELAAEDGWDLELRTVEG